MGEGAKKKVEPVTVSLEEDLVYPLLRGRDIERWRAAPSAYLLLTQDPAARQGIEVARMEKDYPKTHSYLKRFEEFLKARRDRGSRGLMQKGAPFWSIFSVAEYTLAPWKVVWRELDNEIDAAVLGNSFVNGTRKAVVPDHTCILAECGSETEAHYICAMINSSAARFTVRQYIVLHPDPHVFKNVGIPQFSEKNNVHRKLAEMSKAAHVAASSGDDARVREAEMMINSLAGEVWGLTNEELKDIALSLGELSGV